MFHRTNRNAEIGRFGHQSACVIVDVDEGQTIRAKENGCNFVANQVHQHSYTLHTTEKACVLDDVIKGAVVLCHDGCVVFGLLHLIVLVTLRD